MVNVSKISNTFLFLFLNKILVIRAGIHSGSVVECLTRDQEAAGLSLTRITVLWSLSKTHLS